MPVAHYSCPLKSLKIVAVHPSVAELLLGLEVAAWHCWNDLCIHVHDKIHAMYDHHTVSHLATSMDGLFKALNTTTLLSRACKLRELCISLGHTKFRWLS